MVQYILAGGKKRPFFFSYKALKKYCQDAGKSLNEALVSFESLDFQHIEILLFRGFEAGAKKEKIEVDFEADDIEDWIDDDFQLIGKTTELIGSFFGSQDKNGEAVTEAEKKSN